jgi:trk system potassium uptake protein TrkH
VSENARICLRDLGLLVHVPGLMAAVSIPVALVAREHVAIVPLGLTAVLSLVAGQALFRAFRRSGETRLHHAITVSALAWLFIPIVGILPFVGLSDTEGARVFADPWNAIFEAYSGFTGTGLTVVPHPAALPRTLQWWRSFSQWVGGVGVIMVMLSILRPTAGIHRLYFSELREERIRAGVRDTVRTIWWIFVLYTIATALLFRVAGMGWWEAVNHGMTGIATGGFTVTDDSFASYPVVVRLVALPVMLAGAISFAVHDRALRGQVTALWRDLQQKALLTSLAVGSAIVLADVAWTSPAVGSVDAWFQWVSALTTAGFQSSDPSIWAVAPKLLIVLGMIIGGAAGSTVGGIKQIRLVHLVKGVIWRAKRMSLRPHELQRYGLDGTGLTRSEATERVESAATLAIAWLAMLALAVLVLLHVSPSRFDLSDVIWEVASAQGNVGLSTGLSHASLHWLGKLVLVLSMYVGRLEIIPVLLLAIGLTSRRP